MLDFGSSENHLNRITVPDRDGLDALSVYSVAFRIRVNASPTVGTNILGKLLQQATLRNGWSVNLTSGRQVALAHADASAVTVATASTTPLVVGTVYSFVITWDGSTARYYLDGVADGAPSFSQAITGNAEVFALGGLAGGTATGAPVSLGHVKVWREFVLDAGQISEYHQGNIALPNSNLPYLEYWHRGTSVPGVDRARRAAPTTVGTVTFRSDASDGLFLDERLTLGWRRSASEKILRQRSEEQIYTLTVPDKFLSLDLMNLINVAHDALPRSATQLTTDGSSDSIPELLTQKWRRYIARVVGIDDDPLVHQLRLRFKDHESFAASFWTTFLAPGGSNQVQSGVARIDNGAVYRHGRLERAYLEQQVTRADQGQAGAGVYFAEILPFSQKINHLGLLNEGPTDNPILNSVCASETSWTSVDNGGTTDLDSERLAWPASLATQSHRVSRTDDADNTYREQAFSVTTAVPKRRMYFTKAEAQEFGLAAWQLQRASDSFYWNDTTPGWQAGAVWNIMGSDYDGVNNVSRLGRWISKPISVASDTTWTIRVGVSTTSLDSGGGTVYIASVSPLGGHLVHSEVPTTTAAVSVPAPLDNLALRQALPQVVSSVRGSVTFELEAVQNGADLEDGDQLCLLLWHYGDSSLTTDLQDFDVILYEKLASQNVRFAYARYIGGTLDAKATYDISIVRGTAYRIKCIYTDEAGSELGEAPSTLQIYVDNAPGVKAVASANHDDAEATTELWFGHPTTSPAFEAAMNYIRHVRFWTRVLMPEEVG